jgi:hypothetical protein
MYEIAEKIGGKNHGLRFIEGPFNSAEKEVMNNQD